MLSLVVVSKIINQPNMIVELFRFDSIRFDSILCGGKPGDLFASLPIDRGKASGMQTIRSADIGPTIRESWP